MIVPGRIAPGQPIRLTSVFRDSTTGQYQDPATLQFILRQPCGDDVTYTYGTDAALVKDSTGNFHIDVTPDGPGRWHFRWLATGSGAAATEDFFVVQKSRFVHGSDCFWDYS